MNERLKSAIGADAVVSPAPASEQKQETPAEQVEEASKVQTTDEEMAGFRIVQAICYAEIDNIERIVSRDTQSYFGILLDDNNRKPICRLHFNTANKYIEVFDESRIGTKHLINSLSDIYKYQAQIISALKMY